MTFPMYKYFSSEDLDFLNLTKFSLHFSHFSLFFYTFLNFRTNKIKEKWKKKCKRGGLTTGPYTPGSPACPPPLLLACAMADARQAIPRRRRASSAGDGRRRGAAEPWPGRSGMRGRARGRAQGRARGRAAAHAGQGRVLPVARGVLPAAAQTDGGAGRARAQGAQTALGRAAARR